MKRAPPAESLTEESLTEESLSEEVSSPPVKPRSCVP